MSSADRRFIVLIGAAQVSGTELAPAQAPIAIHPIALAEHALEHALSATRALVSEADAAAAIRIVVSDAWLSSIELPWADALLDDRSRPMHVNAQLELMGVNVADCDVLIDDAPFGVARLATAIPRTLIDGIARCTSERSTPVTIQPLSVMVNAVVARQLSRADYAFAVVEKGAATIVVSRGQRVQQVFTQYLSGDPDVEIGRWWRRLILRDVTLKQFDTLHVVDLSGGGGVAGADILRSVSLGDAPAVALATMTSHARPAMTWQVSAPQRLHGPGLAAVAASALLFLTAVVFAVVQQRNVQEAQVRRVMLTEAPVQKPRVQSRVEQERLAGLREQLRMLDMPLDDLLLAVRPPRPLRAALLGMDLNAPRSSAASATLRLTAEAASSEDMAGYVAHLAHTAPFTAAHLTRHEISSPGVYRFTVEASWVP